MVTGLQRGLANAYPVVEYPQPVIITPVAPLALACKIGAIKKLYTTILSFQIKLEHMFQNGPGVILISFNFLLKILIHVSV